MQQAPSSRKSSVPLIDLKAAELQDITAKLTRPDCAEALAEQGLNGEALAALLEMRENKGNEILLDLLPKSASVGERLIFTRRISEQFKGEVRHPTSPESCNIAKNPGGSKRRLLPFALLAYVAWEVGSIMYERYLEHDPVVLSQASDTIGHMYSWLGWGPVPGTKCYEAMQEHFSGAMPSRVVVERVKESLRPFGMNTANTIYAEATCSDEINHEPQRLGSVFTDVWGSVFHMGGIGGFPYGGQAALGAFAGHVPDGGNMFVLYGPHVGVSEAGEVGAVMRTGQSKCTTACGALMGIYKNCLNGLTTGNYTEIDDQAKFIHDALNERLSEIQSSDNPEAVLPRVAFDVAHEQVVEMTKKMKLDSGYLVLLGGIQINTPDYMLDQFLPLHYSIQSKYMPRKDLTLSFDTAGLDQVLEKVLSVKQADLEAQSHEVLEGLPA